MPNIAIGGGIKAFHRVCTAAGQYLPDATTIGSRENAAAGDSDINGQLDAVVQASGEGFINVNNKNVLLIAHGWTDAEIVVQAYVGIGSIGWATIKTITDLSDAVLLNFTCPFPIRVGVGLIGADAATLKLTLGFGTEGY